ncbi:MAG: hypothetical protein PUE04_07930 [Lachnospira sp.]|nr:hypothetical protein [Lachnospira sp.]
MTEKTFLKVQTAWPLAAGAAVYAVLSPDVWFVRGLGHIFPGEILSVPVSGSPLLRFVRNYIPDLLWGFALTSALLLAVRERTMHLTDRAVLVISCLFSAALELLQLFPWITGTFDMADIVAEWGSNAAAVMAAGVISHRKGEHGDETKGGEGGVCGGSDRVRGDGGRKRFFCFWRRQGE